MERLHPAAALLGPLQPVVVDLPHLITALDAELIGKVVHLTRSRPGIHPLPAPFDEEDRYDITRDVAPLLAWGYPLNQGEILAFSTLVQEAVFGSQVMFVDSRVDESVLAQMAVTMGERLSSGAWVTRGFQELPNLAALVEVCQWLLIPVGVDRGRALFLTAQGKGAWAADLEEWCEREGRNHGVIRQRDGDLILAERLANPESRDRAIHHLLDEMLGRHELYFGPPDDGLGGVVLERIRHRRKLQAEIARAKGASPSPPG